MFHTILFSSRILVPGGLNFAAYLSYKIKNKTRLIYIWWKCYKTLCVISICLESHYLCYKINLEIQQLKQTKRHLTTQPYKVKTISKCSILVFILINLYSKCLLSFLLLMKTKLLNKRKNIIKIHDHEFIIFPKSNT